MGLRGCRVRLIGSCRGYVGLFFQDSGFKISCLIHSLNNSTHLACLRGRCGGVGVGVTFSVRGLLSGLGPRVESSEVQCVQIS